MDMTSAQRPDFSSLRAALDAARVVFGAYERTPVSECWRAAQAVLQQVLQRPELTGQALVGEARRLQVLSLPDAHALVALTALADRATGPATTEAERIQLREAWMALQHAVPADVFESPVSPFAPPSAPAGTPGASPYAPGNANANASANANTSASASASASSNASARQQSSAWSPPSAASSVASPTPIPTADDFSVVGESKPRRTWWPIAALGVVVLAVGAGAVWWFTSGRTERLYNDGVAAYTRGAREVARDAFVELAQKSPADPRPLIYLGRMSREDADLARSRRFLTEAVRLAPSSAVAQRELASAMLADGQPEIARRFYVHALELDPTDHVAQGFLGCALYRLQRYEEAQRWVLRAGTGDWQRCIGPMPPPGAAFGAAPLPPAPVR